MGKAEAVLLLNAAAGRSRNFREDVTHILRKRYNLEVIVATDKQLTLQRLRKTEPDIVFVAGGDGTINSTLPYLLESGACLGVLPFGSGNGLARNLRIPLNPLKAARLYLEGKTRLVDVGLINSRIYFINVAGVGFDAFIAHEFETSGRRGITPYVVAALKGFFSFQEFEFEGDQQGRAFIIAFANFPQYGGEARIAPGADPGDGKIDIVFLRKPSLPYALSRVPLLFTDMISRLKIYRRIKAERFFIKLKQPQLLHYDGESGPLLTEVEVRVLPSKVKIFVK